MAMTPPASTLRLRGLKEDYPAADWTSTGKRVRYKRVRAKHHKTLN